MIEKIIAKWQQKLISVKKNINKLSDAVHDSLDMHSCKTTEKFIMSFIEDLKQVKNLTIPVVVDTVCDKTGCKHYNDLFNRCKFQNGYCALIKQT